MSIYTQWLQRTYSEVDIHVGRHCISGIVTLSQSNNVSEYEWLVWIWPLFSDKPSVTDSEAITLDVIEDLSFDQLDEVTEVEWIAESAAATAAHSAANSAATAAHFTATAAHSYYAIAYLLVWYINLASTHIWFKLESLDALCLR